MKRVLCGLLAVLMMLSLSACRNTEPTEKEADDVPEVTCKELLASGYGVDEFKSVTLGLLFEVESQGFSGHFGGIYEEDEKLWHLVVDEITPINEEEPFYFEVYYDKTDNVVYMAESAGWTKHSISDYDVGFHRLSSINPTELVESPRLEVDKSGFKVAGFSTNGVVSDLMSFAIDNVDLTGELILTTFTYDLDHFLNNMRWESDSIEGRFVIDATVSKVNNTFVSMPFNAENAIDGDASVESALGLNDWLEFVPGCDEGEKLLALEYFGVDYVREFDFVEGIPERYRTLSEGVLYMARYYYNSYSIEGFQRMVASSKPSIEEEYQATVLVCDLTGIPLECLWQNGFMMQSECENIKVVLGID